MNHWLIKDKPAILLAPMEGVTDEPMRTFMSETFPFTHLVTEFLRVSSHVPNPRTFRKHMPEITQASVSPKQVPVILQLLGGDPDRLARTAVLAIESGAKAVDLNFGCPAPTVNRHDGGATLLKYPDRLYTIVKAVRDAVPKHIPVSAKIRLGFDSIDPVNHNAEQIFKAGASWLTIHARTKTQGYRPPVFWQKIAEVRKTAPVPVVANGDIWTFEDFLRCQEITQCQHFMFGRSALANPFLIVKVAKELGLPLTEEQSFWYSHRTPDSQTWLKWLVSLSALATEREGTDKYAILRVKQWLAFRNLKHPTPCFHTIKLMQHICELYARVQSHYHFAFDEEDSSRRLDTQIHQ